MLFSQFQCFPLRCCGPVVPPQLRWHDTQETQLSLINRATHLCKCKDVADLTSVIKIRLKNWFLTSGLSRPLKVIGTDTDRSAICDFLLVFYSNFVPKTHRFWDIQLQKCCDLENRITGPSRSLEMSPFDRAHTTSYWRSIVTMALSRVVSEIINVKKKSWNPGQMSLKWFDRLTRVSY